MHRILHDGAPGRWREFRDRESPVGIRVPAPGTRCGRENDQACGRLYRAAATNRRARFQPRRVPGLPRHGRCLRELPTDRQYAPDRSLMGCHRRPSGRWYLQLWRDPVTDRVQHRATSLSRPEHCGTFAAGQKDDPVPVSGWSSRRSTSAFNRDQDATAIDGSGVDVKVYGLSSKSFMSRPLSYPRLQAGVAYTDVRER